MYTFWQLPFLYHVSKICLSGTDPSYFWRLDRSSNEKYDQAVLHMAVQIHLVQPNTTTCSLAYP